ncbi:DUF192 domain-containing protein [Candidatus Woesearchaeota archaeon]|nr:DUF192 domain-containing protein [Candidatus Woesearchaeota archaeon]
MKLMNKTKNKVIARNCKLCRSAWSKAKGLMFTREGSVKRNALVFEFGRAMTQSLHMFFVFYPIDVLFLDEKRKVVEIKQDFKPFSIYTSKRKARYVVELPRSAVRRSKTGLGDVIRWR